MTNEADRAFGSLLEEARHTARVLAGPARNNPPVVRVINDLADAYERMDAVLSEVAVGVVLAADLSSDEQIAALWRVVRHHAAVAKEALNVVGEARRLAAEAEL